MAITTKHIKQILNENYNRLTHGSDKYRDSLGELAAVLSKREDMLESITVNNRVKDELLEMERFRTQFEQLKAYFNTFGDSFELRKEIQDQITDYVAFLDVVSPLEF